MKKWLISLMVVTAVLLVACNSNSNDDETVDKNTGTIDPAALEVIVEILTPEKLAVNEKVELQAKVSQNKEAVDDAEVKFEVWESGFRDKGQMIEGTLDKDGLYKADITFDHDGVYYMFAHTNARGSHVMPKQKLIVGNPDMSKVVEDESSDSMEGMEDHGDSMNHEDNSNDNSTESHNDSSHSH